MPSRGIQSLKAALTDCLAMFGTSGIRGVVGDTVTPDLARRIGAAAADFGDTVTLGRDTRISGPGLAEAVAAGVTSRGADVGDCGVAATPTVARRADDVAVVVTASHNPAEYNGFKLFTPAGTSFGAERRDRVEALLEDPQPLVAPSDVGATEQVEDAEEDHVEAIVDHVGSADVRVVVDGAGGAAATATPSALRRMGCEVVTLNCDHDGSFDARRPEPTEEAVGDLLDAVDEYDADLGVAHDGDGDRAAAVDDRGRYVPPDRLIALFAQHLGADTVVTTVGASRVVDAVADTERTPVGDTAVAQRLAETGAVFGGEPSNTYIFPEATLCPDGIHAAAVLAAMATEEPLSERLAGLPAYTVRRGTVDCPDDGKSDAMERVAARLPERVDGEVTTVDGVRVDGDDGWVLVRPSGTEPVIRLTVEADDEAVADDLFDRARAVAEGAVEEAVGA